MAKVKQPKVASGVPKHKSKRPSTGGVDLHAPEKKPYALHIEHDDPLDRCPVWRFGNLDPDWPNGAKGLNSLQFREVHQKLGSFESQTIREIWATETDSRVYQVDDVPAETHKRLVELERDDEVELRSLRLQGRFRVIGILRENVYYVLWIDPLHEVWPSKKKNT